MKIVRFVSIIFLSLAFHTAVSAQKGLSDCNLVKKPLKIQECSVKSKTLEKVLDEMANKIEEEEVFGVNMPYSKVLFLDEYLDGFKAKLSIGNGYLYLEDLDMSSTYFFNYKGAQILIIKMDGNVFEKFFELSKNKGEYFTYDFFNKDNIHCLVTLHIDQKIIYEIRGDRYRFQEKTLTHTELNW